MARNAILPFLVAALLAACASPAEREAQQAPADDAACLGYGFKAGTDGYAMCRLQLARDHAGADAARDARRAEAFREAGRIMSRPVGGTTCVQTGNILSCR